MIKCQCPMCKESFDAEPEWVGQQAQCPNCNSLITITVPVRPSVVSPVMPSAMPQVMSSAMPPMMSSVMPSENSMLSAGKIISLINVALVISSIIFIVSAVLLLILGFVLFSQNQPQAGGALIGQGIALVVFIVYLFAGCRVAQFVVIKLEQISQSLRGR